jgi:hypothetical protein
MDKKASLGSCSMGTCIGRESAVAIAADSGNILLLLFLDAGVALLGVSPSVEMGGGRSLQ